MPLPQTSLQINFFQGPPKTDTPQPVLRNPCNAYLSFLMKWKLCIEDFHSPLIAGLFLSEVVTHACSPKLSRQLSMK